MEAVHAFGSALLFQLVLLALFAQLASKLVLLQLALGVLEAVAVGGLRGGFGLAVTIVVVFDVVVREDVF